MAKQTLCLSNLRHLDVGLLMYSSDFDDKLPFRDAWMDSTGPYLDNASVEHCPEVEDGLYGYALNASVKSAKEGSVATTALVYDSVNVARNASDLGASLPKPGRHHGRNNVAYLDGHAHAVRSAAPLSP